jgi:hypothetical protein
MVDADDVLECALPRLGKAPRLAAVSAGGAAPAGDLVERGGDRGDPVVGHRDESQGLQ